MPASTPKQRMMMGIAEHEPGKLYKRNRGVLKMSHGQLHDFAATKGLGPTHHDTAPPGGLAHQGTTVEGPDFGRSKRTGADFSTGNREDAQDFAHAGTTREGPNWRAAATAGPTVSRMGSYDQPHGFANAGSSREGPTHDNCLRSASADRYPGSVTRPRIRRKGGSREHSGGNPDGFRVHTKPARDEQPDATSHYGTNRDEAQGRERNPYSATRPGQGSATIDMGVKPSPSPAPPGRHGRHAFKMAEPDFKGDKWLKPGAGPSAPSRGRPLGRRSRQAFKTAIPRR